MECSSVSLTLTSSAGKQHCQAGRLHSWTVSGTVSDSPPVSLSGVMLLLAELEKLWNILSLAWQIALGPSWCSFWPQHEQSSICFSEKGVTVCFSRTSQSPLPQLPATLEPFITCTLPSHQFSFLLVSFKQLPFLLPAAAEKLHGPICPPGQAITRAPQSHQAEQKVGENALIHRTKTQ